MLKVLAYNVREDEVAFFHEYADVYDLDVRCTIDPFSSESAYLAKGHDAIIIQGNCIADERALEIIHELGIKILTTRCAGYDKVDLEAAQRLGIRACNVPAYSPNAVSEYAVTLALACVRNLPLTIRRMHNYNFAIKGLIGREVKDMTIGIIGTGRIGYETIRNFRGFTKSILAYDLYPNDKVKEIADYVSLDELLKRSDIISIHCPLTKDNYHLIDKEAIAKMKDGVVLINTSRGALIDAQDVLDGIEAHKIAKAALDVYEYENGLYLKNNAGDDLEDQLLKELINHNNIIVTPHIAFYTDEAVKNMVQISLSNIAEIEKIGSSQNELI